MEKAAPAGGGSVFVWGRVTRVQESLYVFFSCCGMAVYKELRGGRRVDVVDLPGVLSEVMCIRGYAGTPASPQWVLFVYLDS